MLKEKLNKVKKDPEAREKKAGAGKLLKKKQSREKVPKVNARRRWKISFNSLITRMVAAFLVLIVMILLLGIVSYSTAKRLISNEVKSSLSETVSAEGSYIELGLSNVDDRMLELIGMDDMSAYYLNPDLDVQNLTPEQTTAKGNLQNQVEKIKSISEFVYHIYLMGDMGTGITTTSGKLSLGYYETFLASDEGARIDAAEQKYGYIGAHPFLEETVHATEEKFECDDYAISMWRKINMKANVILVVDIDRDAIYNALAELNNGDDSYTMFIAPDGNETVFVGSDSGEAGMVDEMPVFAETSAYQQAIASGETDGFLETRFQGKSYVFAYSQIGDSGALLAALVPTSQFLGSAASIRMITVLMVFAAFVVAVVMCFFLSRSLGGGVAEITNPLDKASKGDFTVALKTKRKDEFGAIAASASNMIEGIRSLILEMRDVMEAVKSTSELVGSSTDRLMESSEEISDAIGEIESGVTVQAEDSQECVVQINSLSEEIKTVYDYTDEITRISAEASNTIAGSMAVVDELSEKSKATADITSAILTDIMSLNELTKTIGKFVDIINGIAEQTNLLSLNASIEAARAGEAGRGFSVVAEEIRNLADQSVQSADQIGGIVAQIQNQTKQTVESVHKADEIVSSQSSSLDRTLEAFNNVSAQVQTMVDNLSKITAGMELIETTKKDAVNAITNISAVSEETSANASQVDENAKKQKDAVKKLNETVELLKEKSKQMEDAVSLFKVE